MKELQIKTLLVESILNENSEAVIGSEVSFEYGTRRADIVSLKGIEATAYEIKGAEDNTERLSYQIESYKKYFDYCFVVCEQINLNQVRKAIGKEIGIIVVSNDGIKFIRKSKLFLRLNKESLASTLPTAELRKNLNNSNLRSKHELCQLAARSINLNDVKLISRKHLLSRYSDISSILRHECGKKISSDDILTITRMPPNRLIMKS